MAGIELIAAERERQIEHENMGAEHDDTHEYGELALAGAAYAIVDVQLCCYAYGEDEGVEIQALNLWPWEDSDWKPNSVNPIHNLVRAGALIAAEIDRRLRLSEKSAPS